MDDYLSVDELEGVGALDIVGAAQIKQRGAYSIENLMAGFPLSASIGIGATDSSTLVPVRPIRATKLYLDAGFVVAECAVDQLRVGAVNQNIGNGPLPAAMFSGDAVAPPLKGDTIQPNVGAVLTLVNNTAGAITDVTKAIVGPAAV